MQITVTISDDELQRVCEDKIRRILAEHVGSYAYQNMVRDLVYKTVREKTVDIVKTSISDLESLKEMVMKEIERKIRMNVAREMSKKDEE